MPFFRRSNKVVHLDQQTPSYTKGYSYDQRFIVYLAPPELLKSQRGHTVESSKKLFKWANLEREKWIERKIAQEKKSESKECPAFESRDEYMNEEYMLARQRLRKVDGPEVKKGKVNQHNQKPTVKPNDQLGLSPEKLQSSRSGLRKTSTDTSPAPSKKKGRSLLKRRQ